MRRSLAVMATAVWAAGLAAQLALPAAPDPLAPIVEVQPRAGQRPVAAAPGQAALAQAQAADPNQTQPGNIHQPWPYGQPYYNPPPTNYYLVPGGVYPGTYGYESYDYWHHHHPYPYPYPWYRYYYAPLYIPAEELYGPRALKRFMGWDRPNVPLSGGNGLGLGATRRRVEPIEPADAAAPPKREPIVRGAKGDVVASAWKSIGLGDGHFANQKFADAYAAYRKAVTVAPQLPDAFFRQGYALIALGRFEIAANVIKRGLQLDPGWPASEFTNNELYGENQLVKKAHLDALGKAAEAKPQDADLQFLLGVFLHFDDQPDRAAPLFKRAAELGGGDDKHLRGFVEK